MKSWRNVLPIHPDAELFPPLPRDELRELGEDIRKHGLTSPIAVTVTKLPIGWKYELVDGINRLTAMEAIGIPFRIETRDGRCTVDLTDSGIRVADVRRLMLSATVIETDPLDYVVSANVGRRHLTVEQKRHLIAKLIKAEPNKSDRQIAETVKASPTTVGTVRAEMEAKGDVSKLDTRRDRKGRKQPARKAWGPEKYRAKEKRRAATADTAPISNSAETTGGGKAPDLTRGQCIRAELAGYAESHEVTANTYNALLDAWYSASADDRRRFLHFIGAQFIVDVTRPAELKADTGRHPARCPTFLFFCVAILTMGVGHEA